MALEFGLYPTDFDYQKKGVAVDSIEIGSDGKKITVRTGLELLSDADIDRLNEANARTEQYKVHVSTVDEEYVFSLYDTDFGSYVSKWKDGETNQFVYTFEGIKGKILEVEYTIHETPLTWGPNSNNHNSRYLALTETYGQALYGHITPSADVPVNTAFSSVLLRNRVISTFYENVKKYENTNLKNTTSTTPGFNDRFFDPFLDYATGLNTGAEIPWQADSSFYGGGIMYVTQMNLTPYEVADGKGATCEAFIGKWI